VASNRARTLAVAAAACLASGCGGGRGGEWTLPNGDLAGTRSAAGAKIDSGNVARLRPRWLFRFRAPVSYSGIFASTPIADAQTVHVQDPRSNVFALDRFTGARRWARRFDNRNDGPNGLALGDGRIYGATDSDAVAARCENGCVVAPSPHEQARTGRAADISV